MLKQYLENLIGKEQIKTGEILIEEEDSSYIISTNKGALGIKPSGENWEVTYLSLTPKESEEVFNGNNKIIKEWYEQFLKSKKNKTNYTQLPYFQKTLSLKDALDVSSYILAKMVPIESNQNNHLN